MSRFASFIKLAVAIAVVGNALVGVTPQAQAEIEFIQFTSVSKNIDCLVGSESDGAVFANCLVQNATWKNEKPRPADCELDWDPNELTLTAPSSTSQRARVSIGGCRGDIGALCGPECKVLQYGKSISRGRITCTSSTTGITCATTKGKKLGFLISKSTYKVLT